MLFSEMMYLIEIQIGVRNVCTKKNNNNNNGVWLFNLV